MGTVSILESIRKCECVRSFVNVTTDKVYLNEETKEAFTEDMAVAEHREKNGRYRLLLRELYGRRSDLIYDTQGRAVTPYLITNNMWNVEGVKQFRFLQTGLKEYELRLNGDRSRMDTADMNTLLNFEGRVRQAKCVQTDVKNYTLTVNPEKDFNEDEIVAAYRKYLGDDAVIEVNYTDDLPIQQSGKTMVCENRCAKYLQRSGG